VRRAKLHLVDLAGSERAHKTGATGQTLREATYINQRLPLHARGRIKAWPREINCIDQRESVELQFMKDVLSSKPGVDDLKRVPDLSSFLISRNLEMKLQRFRLSAVFTSNPVVSGGMSPWRAFVYPLGSLWGCPASSTWRW
jgi:hypothetical protein